MAQPSQGFNPTQVEMTQPFLMDLLSMYPPQHDHLDDNVSNATLSFQTSHTHGKIEWGPNQEPLFLPIILGQESVPTTFDDEQSQTFEFYHPYICIPEYHANTY